MEKAASKNSDHRWQNSSYFANQSHDMTHFDNPPNNDNPQHHFTASQQSANNKGDGVITAKRARMTMMTMVKPLVVFFIF